MRRPWLQLVAVALACAALPLAGVVATGADAAPYLAMPPRPAPHPPAPFSWPHWWACLAVECAGLFVLFVLPLVRARGVRGVPPARGNTRGSVWLLAAGGMWTALAWCWAWTPGLPGREHTFTFLWAGYILAVNGLVLWRTGRSRFTDAPGRLAGLALVSALFWWSFEFLNRFVHNWHYVGAESMDGLTYFLRATPPFATVLPAVLSTCDLLHALAPGLWERFAHGFTIPARPGAARAWMCAFSALALLGIGVRPDLFYPVLWLAPLGLLMAARTSQPDGPVACWLRGDWRDAAPACVAALVCGFFWEMWNQGSLVRWEYTVPYVQRFHLFQMPILGYAGYLPFGLECLLVAHLAFGEAPANPGRMAALKRGVHV